MWELNVEVSKGRPSAHTKAFSMASVGEKPSLDS